MRKARNLPQIRIGTGFFLSMVLNFLGAIHVKIVMSEAAVELVLAVTFAVDTTILKRALSDLLKVITLYETNPTKAVVILSTEIAVN